MATTAARQTGRRSPELSYLEGLPTELLEPILLESNNVNLCLASDMLGRKLSTELAFKTMSMRVLFEALNEADLEGRVATSIRQQIDALNKDKELRGECDLTRYSRWPPKNRYLRSKQKKKIRRDTEDFCKKLEEDRLVSSPHYTVLSAKFMTWERFKTYLGVAIGGQKLAIGLINYGLYTASVFSTHAAFPELRYTDPRVNREKLAHLTALYNFSVLPAKLLCSPFTNAKAEFLHFLLQLELSVLASKRKQLDLDKENLADIAIQTSNATLFACLLSPEIGLQASTKLLQSVLCTFPEPNLGLLDVLLQTDFFDFGKLRLRNKDPQLKFILDYLRSQRTKQDLEDSGFITKRPRFLEVAEQKDSSEWDDELSVLLRDEVVNRRGRKSPKIPLTPWFRRSDSHGRGKEAGALRRWMKKWIIG
ncbi:hypothetical protein CC78DRAFT_357890 [Lojkania enalia]|uniref:Uncharacterized protein n=1 Tax=Lojkania enalia TaxID=147567 RepID=A0A9P4K4Q7_9PLEO|nr:hypothetical protein CC78DRAFT_357890 [Didymosphaeria enalia]